MKRLKLFALLFSITAGLCIWWYCSTRRCLDVSLAQIELGVGLEEVTKLLGKPVNQANYEIEHCTACISSGLGTAVYSLGFNMKPKNIFAPCLITRMSNGARVDANQINHYWLGHQKALWLVTNEKGVVYKRYLMDLSELASPAFAWIKQQINKWK